MITHDDITNAFKRYDYYGPLTMVKRLVIIATLVVVVIVALWSALNLIPQSLPVATFLSNRWLVLFTLAALVLTTVTPWYRVNAVSAVFTFALFLGFSCFLVTATIFLYKMMENLTQTPAPANFDAIVRNQLSIIAILVSMGSVTAAVLGWWVQRRIAKFEALVDEAEEISGTLDGYVGTCAKLALVGADVAISISLPKLNQTQQIPHDTCLALQGLATIFEDKSPEVLRIQEILNKSGNGGRLQLAYAVHLFGKNPLNRDLLQKAEVALHKAMDASRPLTPPHIRAHAALRAGIVQRQAAAVRTRGRAEKLIESVRTFETLRQSVDAPSFQREAAATGLCISLLTLASENGFQAVAKDFHRQYGQTPRDVLDHCLSMLKNPPEGDRLARYYYCKIVHAILTRNWGDLQSDDKLKAEQYAVRLLQEYRGGRYLGDSEVDPFIRLNYLQCVVTLCDLLEILKTKRQVARGGDEKDKMNVHALKEETRKLLATLIDAASAFVSDDYAVTIYDEKAESEVPLEVFKQSCLASESIPRAASLDG